MEKRKLEDVVDLNPSPAEMEKELEAEDEIVEGLKSGAMKREIVYNKKGKEEGVMIKDAETDKIHFWMSKEGEKRMREEAEMIAEKTADDLDEMRAGRKDN